MVYVLLPAYNEEKAIGILIRNLAKVLKSGYLIVAVNDGSSDGTLKILQKLRDPRFISRYAPSRMTAPVNLKIINHKTNRGLGMAIKTGFLDILSGARPDDIVFTMDADNTHPPFLIPKMIDKINQGFDIVIASRYQRGSKIKGVPLLRQVLSFLSALLFKITFPIQGVRDYTGGYRAYRTEILKRGFSYFGTNFINQSGFSVMVDILLKLSKLNLRFCEVPISLRYDQKKGRSKMKLGLTIVETVKLLVSRRLGKI